MNSIKTGPCPGCVCCQSCGAKGFQKIMEEKKMGLAIYRYSGKNKNMDKDSELNTTDDNEDVFIVHNKNNMELPNTEVSKAVGKYKPSCPRCKQIADQLNNLVINIPDIDQNKTIGICKHCKQKDLFLNKYCKCEKILQKFLIIKHKEKVALTDQMKTWLTKIEDTFISKQVKDNTDNTHRIHINIEAEEVIPKNDVRESLIVKHIIKRNQGPEIEEIYFPNIQLYESYHKKVPVKEQEINERKINKYFTQSNLETDIHNEEMRTKYISKKGLDNTTINDNFINPSEEYRYFPVGYNKLKEVSNEQQKLKYNFDEHTEIFNKFPIQTGITPKENTKLKEVEFTQKINSKEASIASYNEHNLKPKHSRDQHKNISDNYFTHLNTIRKDSIKDVLVKNIIKTELKKLDNIQYARNAKMIISKNKTEFQERGLSKSGQGLIDDFHERQDKRDLQEKVSIDTLDEYLKPQTCNEESRGKLPISHSKLKPDLDKKTDIIFNQLRKEPIIHLKLKKNEKQQDKSGPDKKYKFEEKHLNWVKQSDRVKKKKSDSSVQEISKLTEDLNKMDIGFQYVFPKEQRAEEIPLQVSSAELVQATREKMYLKLVDEKEKQRLLEEKRRLINEKKKERIEAKEKALREEEELKRQQEEKENKEKLDRELKEKIKREENKLKKDEEAKKRKEINQLKEKAESAKKQKLEEDKAKKLKLDDEKSQKQKLEKEKAQKQKLEEVNGRKQKLEEDKSQKIKLEEEKALKQKQDDEKIRKQKLEEDKSQKIKLEEEKALKQKQDEEKIKKQKLEEDEKSKKVEQQKQEKATIDKSENTKPKDTMENKKSHDEVTKSKVKDDTVDKVAETIVSKTESKSAKDKEKDEKARVTPITQDKAREEKSKDDKPKVDVAALANEKLKQLLAQQAKAKEENAKKGKQQEDEERKAREMAEKKAKEATEALNREILAEKKKPLTKEEIERNERKKKEEIAKKLNVVHLPAKDISGEDDLTKFVNKRGKPKCLADINITRLQVLAHKSHKKIKRSDCIICQNSDLELDVESIIRRQGLVDGNMSEIIIGNKIFKYKQNLTPKKQKHERTGSLLIKTESVTSLPSYQETHTEMHIVMPLTTPTKDAKTAEPDAGKAVVRYALSDRSFIDKGWTMLPTEKVVRKMNVYRMQPAHPEFDWFAHNKSKGVMTYDSGDRLADFDYKGRGRWYYRNGRVALDYYDAEELNAQQRFVVYSNGNSDDLGRFRPVTVLATFDYLGNGVVFDHAGKIRLKYNQTEGVILDRSLGPVSHWKWHTLNDPPVLQQVMIDTHLSHKDPDITKLGSPLEERVNPDNEEMLAIEFDNFVKEKSKKMSQSFKPFQIKMKALKINEQFSLRVLDQATVYLIFRDGLINLKLNLGMILNHEEIIDTDTAEVGEVSNALERLPARTHSLAGLQRSVAYAQHLENTKNKRIKRLKRPEPSLSFDLLKVGASKPLRPVPIPHCSYPSSTTVNVQNKCRKPSGAYLYHTNKLV